MSKDKYKSGKLLLWLVICLMPFSAFAQQNTISGVVTSAEDGTAIPGANVLIKGTNQGTVTDIDGNYKIEVPSEDVTLVFSFVGYLSEEVQVGTQTNIDISLAPDVTQLEELVVIGYGEKSKKLLTESITSVKAKALEDLPTTTVESALQGKAAGVSILSSTGQPGEPATIRIRGGSTVNQANDPLFIIDGVQRSSEDFNPDDIESIEVLKDAAATAIYGARASNGVILITTKSGTSGKARFNFSYRGSWNELLNELDLLGAEDYLRIERVGLTRSFLDENSAFGAGATATGIGNPPNSPITPRVLEAGENVPAGYQSMTDPVTGQTIIFQDIDWQDELYSTTLTQNFHFSVDGGKEDLTYYLGAAFVDQEGIASGTGYQRFSLQSNVDFQINEKLKVGTNVNFTRSESDEPFSTNSLFSRAARQAPTVRLRFDDGTLAPGVRENLPNPIFFTQNYLNDEAINKLNLGAKLEYEIIPDLIFTGTGNFFTSQTFRDSFVKANFFNRTRSASSSLNESRQTQFEGTLRYSKTFNDDHSLTALIGASRLETDFFLFNGSGSGGGTDAITTLNVTPENAASTFKSEDLLIGYFGRVSYDYKKKYLLSSTLRRDGSSRFGFDNQVGYFPSVSAGWRITEEPFFNVPFISELKLRASWGQTANNALPGNPGTEFFRFFLAQGEVDPSFAYNGQAAARFTALANPDLGWETTTQTDVGFDLGLLENRLELSFDYYKKTTDDLIFARPLPNTSGFGSVVENIGEVQFTGLEFAITSSNLQKGDFLWTTNFNIAFTDNEVLKLPENDLDKNRVGGLVFSDGFTGLGGLAEGEPLGQMIGFQFLKVYSTTAEAQEDGLIDMIANDRTSSNGIDYRKRVGGDVKWLDVNGDGIIDDDDQVVIGNSIPDITGGISNTLTYKGFELFLFMDFALGHRILNQHRFRMNSNSQGNINGTTDLLAAWNEEGDVTDVPRFVFFDFGNANNHHRPWTTLSGGGTQGASSQYIEKGNYLSLRTVRLSYHLPASLLGNISLSSAKVYIAGQNLHYFTDYRGYNPEVTGVDGGRFPLFRAYTIGVNIGF